MSDSSTSKLTPHVEEAIRLASRTPIRRSDLPKLQNIVAWLRDLNQADTALIESLSLRRDMVTLLKYFKEKRPVGTQSTGNLQLKAVREVCAQFVNPPVLDAKIGDKVYKLRSEDDVFLLYYLHMLANTGELVTGGQARAWRLTPAGEVFLELPPAVQLGYMLAIWWHQEDWTITFPYTGLSRGLPRNFRKTTLSRLLELEVGKPVSYEPFADDLIATTGLTWSSKDQTYAHNTLRSAVKRMVIYPMEWFGCVVCEYKTKTSYGFKSQELIEFRLTQLGKGLLGTL
ncbi:MAG: hypothetical protein HZB19_13730 [Chloroflexi bacterium]|nr:hypothetical protein [Chloroflexota bacterium]